MSLGAQTSTDIAPENDFRHGASQMEESKFTPARRIAPAASPVNDESSQTAQSSATAATGKSGIKRASTACQNCKNIKRKCNQQQPCSNCLKTGTDCIYDQAQDGRRRAARKGNVEELELKRDALDTILDAFRQSDDESVQILLSMIRTNAPLDDIIRFSVAHSEVVSESPITSLNAPNSAIRAKRSVLSINALCDTPSIRVPAAPWTTVTDDDDLVSHLISIYFTWYHPAYPCVTQDLFIEAMKSQEEYNTFCCPLLVNSILAIACHFSDHPGVFKDPDNSSSRGQHFLEHAMHLWREAGHLLRLTTVQAGQQIALALMLCGKDRLGYLYMSQTKASAEDVAFQVQRAASSAANVADIRRSLGLALWSQYMLNVDYSLAFMRTPDYTRPSVERPSLDDSAFRNTTPCQPYPNSQSSVQTNFGKLAHLQYDLHGIGAQVAAFVFGEQDNALQILRELDHRLTTFSQRIPWSDEGTTLNPHNMDLNLCYHWIRMTLFNFVKISTITSELSPEASDGMTRYVKEQCLTSARITAGLHRRYIHDYGSRDMTVWMPQTALSTAYMLIDELDKPEVQDIFHDVCSVLASISRRWALMRGHARMLYITVEHGDKPMADRTKQMLGRVALDLWKPDEHKSYDGSVYPNYALAKVADPRAAGMGELLDLWANATMQADAAMTTSNGGSDGAQSTSDGMSVS